MRRIGLYLAVFLVVLASFSFSTGLLGDRGEEVNSLRFLLLVLTSIAFSIAIGIAFKAGNHPVRRLRDGAVYRTLCGTEHQRGHILMLEELNADWQRIARPFLAQLVIRPPTLFRYEEDSPGKSKFIEIDVSKLSSEELRKELLESFKPHNLRSIN